MINNLCQVNVSIVFYDNYSNMVIEKDKLDIFLRLIENLNNNKYICNILVVDNSPVEFLKNKLYSFIKVKYYFSNSNIGFSKGHNLSVNLLKNQRFHLVLNPDIIIEDNLLIEKLVRFLDNNERIVMVQPLIIGYPNLDIQFLCKENPTLFIQIIRGFFRRFIDKIIFLRDYNYKYEMRDKAYSNSIIESTYLSGAFMFCRRDALDKIKWFDERFFMYLEDADITRRLSKIGKCVHNPSVKVRHVWAKGSRNNTYLKFIACISFLKYSLKWGFKFF